MAKNNFLVLIRKRIDEIHREYSALRSAYETLDKVSGLRGRKVVIPDLTNWVESSEDVVAKVKKGKRGRPRKNPFVGANTDKNDTKIKKRGRPRKNPFLAANTDKNDTRIKKGKRGRKKSVVAVSKELSTAVKPVVKSAEPLKNKAKAEAPKKKSPGRPRLNKSVNKSVKPVKPVKTKSVADTKKVNNSKSLNKAVKNKKRSRVPNLASRITDIIKEHNRFITNADITDKLADTYPSKDKVELSKYLSVVMSQMKGRKEVAVIVKDHKGKRMRSGLWGLPGWFENGKPKNEYLK